MWTRAVDLGDLVGDESAERLDADAMRIPACPRGVLGASSLAPFRWLSSERPNYTADISVGASQHTGRPPHHGVMRGSLALTQILHMVPTEAE